MSSASQKPLALISVSNKEKLVPLAKAFNKRGIEIIGTQGTKDLLAKEGILVTALSDYTNHEEILHGRVKTLHPKIHAGILYNRDDSSDVDQTQALNIRAIDYVVVNLYPFEKQVVNQDIDLEEAIEWIDIGGPTLLRAAAKNWQHCLPMIDPSDYQSVIDALNEHGELNKTQRISFAGKVFKHIANYDKLISDEFEKHLMQAAGIDKINTNSQAEQSLNLEFHKNQDLRYGENPHQVAAFYTEKRRAKHGFGAVNILQGKELSYNNYLDLDSASRLVRHFSDETAVAIVKHSNPCGCAASKEELSEVFTKALLSDPKSSFGGIIACNKTIDARTASAICEIFCECVIAPAYSLEARAILAKKKNLRLIEAPWITSPLSANKKLRSIEGGILVQSELLFAKPVDSWLNVTEAKASPEDLRECLFAMRVASQVKSNAIVLTKHGKTIGIGAGQMSRIDALNLAIAKAEETGQCTKGACLASDAFFPFDDCVKIAAKHGIKTIVQPGGSMRDQDSIAAANTSNISMVFTNERHFSH